jgi:hypothetical protein
VAQLYNKSSYVKADCQSVLVPGTHLGTETTFDFYNYLEIVVGLLMLGAL